MPNYVYIPLVDKDGHVVYDVHGHIIYVKSEGISGTISVAQSGLNAALAGSVVFSGVVSLTEAAEDAALSGQEVITGTIVSAQVQSAGGTGVEVVTGIITATQAGQDALGVSSGVAVGAISLTQAGQNAAGVGAVSQPIIFYSGFGFRPKKIISGSIECEQDGNEVWAWGRVIRREIVGTLTSEQAIAKIEAYGEVLENPSIELIVALLDL